MKFIDCNINKARLSAGKVTGMIDIENCQLTGTAIGYEKQGCPVDMIFRNNTGTCQENGPGLDRKVPHE